MPSELFMEKRPAREAGEIGIFPVNEITLADLAALPSGTPFAYSAKLHHNLRQWGLMWALATIIADSCDWLHDKEDAMDWLKLKARHVRLVHDATHNVTHILPKSIRWSVLEPATMTRLLDRFVNVTLVEIMPGTPKGPLLDKMEKLCGIPPSPPDEAAPVGETRTVPKATGKGSRRRAPAAADETQSSVDREARAGLASQADKMPKTPAEWVPWCLAWIKTETDPNRIKARWNDERKLRNDLGVVEEERQPVMDAYLDRIKELEGR